MSCAEYADHLGLQVESVKGVAEGRLQPHSRILQDMGAWLEPCYEDECVWRPKITVREI